MVEKLEGRFEGLDRRTESIETRQDRMDAELQELMTRLDVHLGKIESYVGFLRWAIPVSLSLIGVSLAVTLAIMRV